MFVINRVYTIIFRSLWTKGWKRLLEENLETLEALEAIAKW
jgi:hypothetical protein